VKAALDLQGVICPILTPFNDDDRIDLPSVRQLVDYLLDRGVHGLMVGGTTGEGMLLSLEEREHLCATVIEHVDGRAPIIAHTGCIGTADTVRLTQHAASAGATAAAMIVPYFFSFDVTSLLSHYVTVAASVPDFPLFIYTFPDNAKNDIGPDLLQKLRAEAPNILGIKSSNRELTRLQEYIDVGGEGFLVFNGSDGLMLPALALGANGQVSGNANVFPEVFRELYEAFVQGDLKRARDRQRVVNQIRRVLRDGQHPAYLKAGLALRGIPAGRVRKPMRELTSQEADQLAHDLRTLGLV
jgi:4-hydroxy-tetrahydrodipicolinate synthase